MTNTIRALQSAVIALKAISIDDRFHDAQCNTEEVYKLKGEALMQCKAALSEIEKCEPVGKVAPSTDGSGIIGVKWLDSRKKLMYGDKLYTELPQLDWVGLSIEWILSSDHRCTQDEAIRYARIIEDKLKQLNAPDMFHPPATEEDMKIYQAIADNYTKG